MARDGRLKDEGYVRHLGVANCHQHHLEEIFKICKYKPEIGQFEIHPLFTQKTLIEYYKKNNILVEAYTPIARYDDRLVRLPLLKKLEKKYNKNFFKSFCVGIYKTAVYLWFVHSRHLIS